MAKRVCIINFKGGVGKTTLAFHLGTGLARFHDQRVLLIDMDHQSSLSIVCLGANGWANTVKCRKTVDAVFRCYLEGSRLPDRGIISENLIRHGQYGYHRYKKFHLVAANLFLDDLEIGLTASLIGTKDQSEWNKRSLICQWLQENKVCDIYDYIIFDCPPATKIVTQNAIAACHSYIVPVVPESVMERGTPHLYKMMRNIDNRLQEWSKLNGDQNSIFIGSTKLTGIVVTRIRASRGGWTNDHSRHLHSLERRWENNLVRPLIPDGVGVSEALSEGVPVYDRGNTQNIGGRNIDELYEELVGNLKQRIDHVSVD